MTIIHHANGQLAWTGYVGFHTNGNTAWTAAGICYHDNQQQAWTGFTAFDRQGNQIATNHDTFELELGSGFVIKHDEPNTDIFLNDQYLTPLSKYPQLTDTSNSSNQNFGYKKSVSYLELTLDSDRFTLSQEQDFLVKLSYAINTSIDDIHILKIALGSILITFELSEEAANTLLSKFDSGDEKLITLQIKHIKKIKEPEQIERASIMNPKNWTTC